MSRGFFSKFLNTGLIFLILGLRQVQAVLGETDLSNNLDVTWYETIAPDVIIISVINILAPHGPVLKRFYKDMKKIARPGKARNVKKIVEMRGGGGGVSMRGATTHTLVLHADAGGEASVGALSIKVFERSRSVCSFAHRAAVRGT